MEASTFLLKSIGPKRDVEALGLCTELFEVTASRLGAERQKNQFRWSLVKNQDLINNHQGGRVRTIRKRWTPSNCSLYQGEVPAAIDVQQPKSALNHDVVSHDIILFCHGTFASLGQTQNISLYFICVV